MANPNAESIVTKQINSVRSRLNDAIEYLKTLLDLPEDRKKQIGTCVYCELMKIACKDVEDLLSKLQALEEVKDECESEAKGVASEKEVRGHVDHD